MEDYHLQMLTIRWTILANLTRCRPYAPILRLAEAKALSVDIRSGKADSSREVTIMNIKLQDHRHSRFQPILLYLVTLIIYPRLRFMSLATCREVAKVVL